MSEGLFEDADTVRDYEAWYSTSYGRIAEELHLAALSEGLVDLRRGARVLDLGCATGRFAAHLRQRGWNVFGIDVSRPFLERAAKRISVACADGRALPFPNRCFEATIITFVLEFLDDPEHLLREARRVTTGPVVLIALCRPSYLSWRRRFASRRGHKMFSGLRHRNVSQWRAVVAAAGMAPASIRRTLFLPPALAGRFPALERQLSRGNRPLGGMLCMTLLGPQ